MRKSWFVIQKRIQNQSSEAQERLKTVRGARESKRGQVAKLGQAVCEPWDPQLEDISGPVWPTRPTRALAKVASFGWPKILSLLHLNTSPSLQT